MARARCGNRARDVVDEPRGAQRIARPLTLRRRITSYNVCYTKLLRYGLARLSLAAAGVDAVFGGSYCTFSDAARFFSHRRGAPCGRMATLIWRVP